MRSSITAFFLFVLPCFFAACGKKPAPAPPPAPVEEVTIGASQTTTGNVLLATKLRPDVTSIEILCVPEVSPETRELILEQHKALQAYLDAPEPDAGDALVTLSESDTKKLNSALEKAKEGFPEPFESTFRIDGKSRLAESRRSLYERYLPMVEAVKVDNLESSLNAIFALMKQDHETLQKLAEDGSSNNAVQAMADMNWLASFSDYMKGFQSVVRRYDSAMRRQVRKINRDAKKGIAGPKTPEEIWEEAQHELAPKIELEIYKTSLGSAYADEDGHFELAGHGLLVARAEMGSYSVFFVNDGPGGELVRFSDVKETETTAE
ncbi:hypothetical protein [Rubellicoccus peritrichatus]|uniref:DUF3347 domain-containing protein n=1 Tax=Rubellicoccus peritrichatus TaxID=3080537 RepID=A0AAQ3LIF8_9BACT|nr:hypothetical protein [Puniceicoccus sp. CR14]WOO42679.1 hypothetical protein RZN69_06210 [Puniceicoccus sp. CR14]